MNKIFAKDREDISKAAIDFFSLGHLLVGYFAYIVLNALFLILFNDISLIFALISIIFGGMLWEVIENTFLVKKNIKFGNRKDSTINSLMDVVMLFLGGFLSGFSIQFDLPIFLIITTTFFIGDVLFMSYYASRFIDISKINKNDVKLWLSYIVKFLLFKREEKEINLGKATKKGI